MKRIILAAYLLVFSHVAFASGDWINIPWSIDPYGGSPAEQAGFYTGNTGILLGRAPWARLFAGWRMLHGLPVGGEAGASLALPCCGGDTSTVDAAVAKWIAARNVVPGVPPIKGNYINVYRPVKDFMSVQTCFPDAFATAVHTLNDRVAAHGATDAAVRAWLDGQDAVFAACSDNVDLPPLDGSSPDWLKADHAYQEAALALYRRDFAKAMALFDAIAADASSPWRSMAPYLAARAAVDAALPSSDPAMFAEARKRLILLAPAGVFGHADLGPLAGALDFRDRADARRRELSQELAGPTLPQTVAADFKDSRRLGQSPAGEPAYLDWIAVFGRAPEKPEAEWFDHYTADQVWPTDADALSHARARWSETQDPAWLIAAMAWTSPGPGAADLIAAARAVAPDHPAFLTALYHRVRLEPGADPAAVRRELDAVLARTELSLTTRNLFIAERALAAADVADLGRLAQRESPCATVDDDDKGCLASTFGLEGPPTSQLRPDIRFGDEAVAIIDRLPLAARVQLGDDMTLPAPLRLDIGLTNYARAALIQDMPTANHVVVALRPLLPQMEAEWKAFLGAKPGEDKRFAAWFILAKIPGASVDLGDGYTRPQGTVAEFDGHWHDWLYATAGAHPVQPPAIENDIVCFGMCGPGAFPFRLPAFAVSAAVVTASERGRFLPADTKTAGSVWEDVLSYAKAHPNDPRSPEALYWLVRISRFGTGHNRSSYRAWVLLHDRYRSSAWAKQSKYFYD